MASAATIDAPSLKDKASVEEAVLKDMNGRMEESAAESAPLRTGSEGPTLKELLQATAVGSARGDSASDTGGSNEGVVAGAENKVGETTESNDEPTFAKKRSLTAIISVGVIFALAVLIGG